MPPHYEDVDIAIELRQYIADVSARLDTIDHYALLGVTRDADAKTVKRAYLRLVGLLHPDRFFRKRLGSYKLPLQLLFTQITVAHDTLTSPAERAAYDASLGATAPGIAGREVTAPARAAAPAGPAPSRSKGDEVRGAMDALRQRFLDARAGARRHAQAGARAREAGDFVAAATAYREALAHTPDDAALKAALEEVQRAAAGRVAESRRKQALLEERYGHWAEAAVSWRRVLEASPDDPEARQHLAGALERSQAARR